MSTGNFDSNVNGVPAVSAIGTNSAEGILARSDSGIGVYANSDTGPAVLAISATGTVVQVINLDGNPGIGVQATLNVGTGVLAQSGRGTGIFASGGIPFLTGDAAIGVSPESGSTMGIGVHAVGGGANATPFPIPNVPNAAIFAEGGPGPGVYTTSDAIGVYATSQSGTGVSGTTESGVGVAANGGSGGIALQVTGKIEVQGNSVGEVIVMGAGKKTLTVDNAAATANSLILLTPLSNPGAFLWIGARNAGSFTIDASNALPNAITIMYLIIN